MGEGPPRVARAAPLRGHLRSPQRWGRRGCSEGSEVAEPGAPWLACLGGLHKMGQRRPETALPLRQARVIGRGQQGETATGHGLEALGGLHARQPPGRPAFAGEQGAGGGARVA